MLSTKIIKATLACSALTLVMLNLSGCIIGATIGGMAES